MKYWRMNTNNEARKDAQEDKRTCNLWYRHGMAFAGDHEGKKREHAKHFDELYPGDGIFMHESKSGFVGFGIVQESWDGKDYPPEDSLVYNLGLPHEIYEYRIIVKWLPEYDRRNSPLKIGQFKLPQLQTLNHIDENKHNVDKIMELLRNNAITMRG